MNSAQIIAKTNNLYQIFKYIVALNPTRFSGMTVTTTADLLVTLTGTDYNTIARWYLEKQISSYADYNPQLGIILPGITSPQAEPDGKIQQKGLNNMKKYMIYWHVKDNSVTYPHNDNMLLYARSADEAESKAWNRIRSEFDYSAADVDHMEVIETAVEY